MYADSLTLTRSFVVSQEELLNAMYFVNEPEVRGTHTGDALRMAVDDVFTSSGGDRSGVPNVVVLLTDGQSNVDRASTAAEALRARNAGVRLIVIAMGQEVDNAEINAVASDPDSSNVYVMNDVTQLEQTASDVLDELCAI